MKRKFNYKYLCVLVFGILLGSLIPMQSILADANIKLMVNGKLIQCDVPPTIINNRVMVPARFVAEPLGANVIWDDSNDTVIITSNGNATTIDTNTNTNSVTNDKSSVNSTVTETVNSNPLRLDNVGETTYETIGDGTYKKAYITVTITNTSDKYVDFIRLKPIVNVNDGRNFGSALDSNKSPSKLEGGYYKPNSNATLVYWAQIPNDIEVTGWELP